jgi:Type II inositol 1,4,5-trisphosphate 5-phosphatase PH domain
MLAIKITFCRTFQTFEAYQVIGAEHQNRLLAIVKSGNSSALFSFNVSNYPPVSISDFNIDSIFPIDETFLIDNGSGYGISTHQFQILTGSEQILYYYYPDQDTCRSKEIFEKTLKKLIQGKKKRNKVSHKIIFIFYVSSFQNIQKKTTATFNGLKLTDVPI